MPIANNIALYSVDWTSVWSSEPADCAIRPVVPMRRKLKPQKIKLKISDPRAIAPINAGLPRFPMTAVSTTPNSGVDKLEIIIGQATSNTCRRLTVSGPCSVFKEKGVIQNSVIFPWQGRVTPGCELNADRVPSSYGN